MMLEPTCQALCYRVLKCVGTYMPATVLLGCRLFKLCQNLPSDSVLQGCRLFKWCRNLPACHRVARAQAV